MIAETARAAAGSPEGKPPLPAGEATRRFLAVAADRPPLALFTGTAKATGAHKRYGDTARLVLTDDPREVPAVPGPALIGHLMRNLLGIGRSGWTYAIPVPQGVPGAGKAVMAQNHRPVPSGGALYPIEAYLAGGAHGFPAGLHHYDRAHHALQRVREGDHRSALTEALAAPPGTLPDLVVVLTAVFWRTGVKYGDFAYKLQCQETGALAAQSLALTEGMGLAARLHLNFDGVLIERLLDLPEGAEGALAVLTLTATGNAGHPRPGTAPRAGELIARPAVEAIDPPPSVTGSLPHLAALHAAARLPALDGKENPAAPRRTAQEPRPDRGPSIGEGSSSGDGLAVRLPEPVPVRLCAGIARRRSAPDGFDSVPITGGEFARILAVAAAGYPGDVEGTSEAPATCEVYAWALRVDGVPPGSYRYAPGSHLLDPAAPWRGIPRNPGRLHLTMLALGEAAAVIFPVGDPLDGISRYGDPWYRLQLIETGLVVHRATLAATALGLTTRIHSDVSDQAADTTLGLHDTGRRSLSALLVGRPPRRTPTRWDPRPLADRHGPD